jgi:hypothetical protein
VKKTSSWREWICRLTTVLGLFRRLDRIEHDLRIGGFCQCLCHFVALIALVWIVAAKFFQERYDLGRFLLAEDGEFQRYLLPARSHLIVVAVWPRS